MDVYEPREDSYLLQKWVKMLAKGKVLDMGTGSGIQAFSAVNADSVLAIDINDKALDLVKKKAVGTNVTVKKSDLFRSVHEKFDVIIFNPPYLPKDEGVEDEAIYGGKRGYEITEKFLKRAGNHLNEEGFILLLFSSLTNKNHIDSLLEDLGYTWSKLDEKSFDFEKLYVYKIWK